jgi:hypothetical protein
MGRPKGSKNGDSAKRVKSEPVCNVPEGVCVCGHIGLFHTAPLWNQCHDCDECKGFSLDTTRKDTESPP